MGQGHAARRRLSDEPFQGPGSGDDMPLSTPGHCDRRESSCRAVPGRLTLGRGRQGNCSEAPRARGRSIPGIWTWRTAE